MATKAFKRRTKYIRSKLFLVSDLFWRLKQILTPIKFLTSTIFWCEQIVWRQIIVWRQQVVDVKTCSDVKQNLEGKFLVPKDQMAAFGVQASKPTHIWRRLICIWANRRGRVNFYRNLGRIFGFWMAWFLVSLIHGPCANLDFFQLDPWPPWKPQFFQLDPRPGEKIDKKLITSFFLN